MLISTLYYVKQESTVYQRLKMPNIWIDSSFTTLLLLWLRMRAKIPTTSSMNTLTPVRKWITYRLKSYAPTLAE